MRRFFYSPPFKAILIGMGLQYKTADELAAELDLPTTQLLGLFNRTIRKISQFLSTVVEQELTAELEAKSGRSVVTFAKPMAQTLSDELEEDAKVIIFLLFFVVFFFTYF